ncbi:hypothetical protein LUX29_05770 [Aureimonas altamirensis]|uniref:hypothetical protein n=1 Tax=Aureimonas altamirensis TaxID=370622 RepID=UPI001E4DED2C|nr:hypothetical protein [Aureimonas altamirensis]UHD46710.1 hypothetical protein LUX29_05770 [Aureimonas altamirensis]
MTNLNDGTMRTLTDGEQERVSGASAEMVTTLAVGEEDGGGGFATTKALGEEDGGWATTMAVGEEDGGGLSPIALDAKIHR